MDTYLDIRWLSFGVVCLITIWLSRIQGIAFKHCLAVIAIGSPAALIGGHLLNVFEAWPGYRTHPERIASVISGGSSIYGAIGIGFISAVAYVCAQGLPLRRFLDATAPGIALGEATTRIGCFAAGCCFGARTDSWVGVTFPRGSAAFMAQVQEGLIPIGRLVSLPVHPTQLYSCASGVVVFCVTLWLLLQRRLAAGGVFSVALFSYGLQRLIVGFWRADGVLYWWELSTFFSIAAMVCAVALWFKWRISRACFPQGIIRIRGLEKFHSDRASNQ